MLYVTVALILNVWLFPEALRLRQYKDEMRRYKNTTRAQIKRLTDRLERQNKKKPSPYQSLLNLSEHLHPTLVSLIKITVKNNLPSPETGRERRQCIQYPQDVKDFSLNLFRSSNRSYTMVQELVHLPPKRSIQQMNRRKIITELTQRRKSAAGATPTINEPPEVITTGNYEIISADAPPKKLPKADVLSLNAKLKGLF